MGWAEEDFTAGRKGPHICGNKTAMQQNTKRFSDRVEDYIKYRPAYPEKIIAILNEAVGLDNQQVIADIGSGTGISSIPFLQNNNTVYGVEPNKEMREAAEQLLTKYNNFISINGSAEKSNLPDRSIDLIFCGQAFHWFDKLKSKTEGHIVLAWNARSTNSNFQLEYENALLEYIEEYKFVNHRNIRDEDIIDFFHPKKMQAFILSNKQIFDLEGLKGRLKSSSYCPKVGLQHDKLMAQMEKIYNKYEIGDQIEFEYETQIYCC